MDFGLLMDALAEPWPRTEGTPDSYPRGGSANWVLEEAASCPEGQRRPVPRRRRPLELGHGSEDMVRRVYTYLGDVRHRSMVVEYRDEQHLEALKDRLGRVGSITRNVTAEG
jgi:hypothetical protein